MRVPRLLGDLLGGAAPPVEGVRINARLLEQPPRRAQGAHVDARVQRRQLGGAGPLVALRDVEVR